MGLLDWLTDLGGSGGGSPSQPFISATNNYDGAGGQPQTAPPPAPDVSPPPQAPSLPPPMAAQPPIQAGGGLPPGPQAPAPEAPPLQAPQAPQMMRRTMTPEVSPAPPGPPMSLSPQDAGGIYDSYKAAGGGQQPNNPGQARGIIGRALGMNSSDETSLKDKLGSGLKAVGENWNKPGLAAFAGSAGSTIEGGTKGEEKRVDQMLKLIQAKQKAGDDSSATSLARVKLETAQMHLQALKDSNGKTGAWNKPPEQLYQDAMKRASDDPNIKASQKALEQTIKNGDPQAIAKAQADHSELISAIEDKHLIGVGLQPQSAAALAKIPGITQGNPIPQSAFNGKSFDQIVKPNADHDQYFVDEKGQTRVLRATKKREAPKSNGVAPASIPSSPADAADEAD